MRGYSQFIVEANREAEPSIGVHLGALCIDRKISATDVSKKLNISKQTVYDWFSGKTIPSYKKLNELQAYIKELSGREYVENR